MYPVKVTLLKFIAPGIIVDEYSKLIVEVPESTTPVVYVKLPYCLNVPIKLTVPPVEANSRPGIQPVLTAVKLWFADPLTLINAVPGLP